MTEIAQTHPLNLPEIQLIIAKFLRPKDLASCARVCQDWNYGFTPLLYKTVLAVGDGPGVEALLKNKNFVQEFRTYPVREESEASSSQRSRMISIVLTGSILNTVDLGDLSIGETDILSEFLKTKSSLTTLKLQHISNGEYLVQRLSEALKTNSTLTTLDLERSCISRIGAVALFEALKSNSTLTCLDVSGSTIRDSGVAALSEALKTNSTLRTLILKDNSCNSNGPTTEIAQTTVDVDQQ